MKEIKLSHVSFEYASTKSRILDDLSLVIKGNTINTILGLNGSGKTTLIKLLIGLLKQTKGSILIDDKDLSKYSILERSRLIAYVPQLSKVESEYTVSDYLTFGMSNRLNFFESPSTDHYENVIKYSEQFNITHLLSKKINEISGGERQIISIC